MSFLGLNRRQAGDAALHIRVRVALAVCGGVVTAGWLILPLGADAGGGPGQVRAGPVPTGPVGTGPVRTGPGASAGTSFRSEPEPGGTAGAEASEEAARTGARTGPETDGETGGETGGNGAMAADLVLPVAAVGTAGAAAAYAHVRRTRRTRTRTTPGGTDESAVPSDELDRRGRLLLTETDDCVRTSAEELAFAAERRGAEATRPFVRALESARGELAAAFRLRQLLDDASDRLSAEDTRRALEEIVTGCTGAGRRLDAQAPAFDQLRALERDTAGALECAEGRFRALTDRVRGAQGTLVGFRERYAPAAVHPVADHVELAKDRLVFATSRLNRARQALDRGDTDRAALRLRAAEGAVHQADVLVTGVERLADELAAAEVRLPEVLQEIETDLAATDPEAEETPGTAPAASAAPVTTAAAVTTAPGTAAVAEVVAEVRRETADGPRDPLDALRRLVRAAVDAGVGGLPYEQGGPALRDGARLLATSSVAAVRDFVTTHRGAVGDEARTRLAEAERHLERARHGPTPDEPLQGGSPVAESLRADSLACAARPRAERDVRAYGDPYGGSVGDGVGDDHGGALLGGVLAVHVPGESGDGPREPACYGGPGARGRRAAAGRT
ncbi:hypothetical protein GCM10010365_05660 [Streptomyces poonensis]|uniref:Fibrillarin n=2 Tax=Streptomyces poonensis TaxID=68255 RepID=A0A918P869_9ACTN|nr:hypothetical protein GCM10010365_05660 [Streptomyces poonensis]GLJ87997.1 hypothetical protein GCM10017589_05970 [Streptomyces poonensis]